MKKFIAMLAAVLIGGSMQSFAQEEPAAEVPPATVTEAAEAGHAELSPAEKAALPSVAACGYYDESGALHKI